MSHAHAELVHGQLAPTLEQLAPNAEWHVSGPVGRARKCDIFKLTNDKQTHTLALKVYREGKINDRGPRNQFKALQKLETTQKAFPIKAPRAHAFIPDANAIVMDWVDAPPLGNALWRSAFSTTDRLQYIKSTAQWLRQFHETSSIKEKPVDYTGMLSQIEKRFSVNHVHQNNRDEDLFFNAYQQLKNIAKNTEMLAPHANLHGDFTPSNVLIQNGKAIGIDIWGWRCGAVFEDITRMLTYLSINTPFALRKTALMNGDEPSTLFKSFINGYGADVIKTDAPTFWLILLYQNLRRWLVFNDWKNQGRSQIKTKLELDRVKRLTAQTLTRLETLI